jgi:hypothetical protein
VSSLGAHSGLLRLPVRRPWVRQAAIYAVAAIAAAALPYAEARFGAKMVLGGVGGLLLILVAVPRPEVLYGVVLAVAFIGPIVGQDSLWPRLMAFTVVFLALRELALGRRFVGSWGVALYVGLYAAVALHGRWGPTSVPALREVLIPAAFGLLTASVARDPKIRKRIALIAAACIVIQIPVVALQVQGGFGSFGQSNAEQFRDDVTGTLGINAGGLMTLMAVLGAIVFAAMAVDRVWRPRLLAITALALCSLGVLGQVRAVFVFVPIGFSALLLTGALLARRRIGGKRLALISVLLVAGTVGVIWGSSVLYPGSNNDINSVAKLRQYLFLPQSGSAPERGGIMELAVKDFSNRPFDSKLLGRGMGSSWLNADPHVLPPQGLGEFTLSPQQQTSSLWLSRMLTEAGVFGIAAFFVLIAMLMGITKRARERVPSGTLDSGLLLALPAVALLTVVGAGYVGVLSFPVSATAIWLLFGLGLAIERFATHPKADMTADHPKRSAPSTQSIAVRGIRR